VPEVVKSNRSLQAYAFPALLLGGISVGCAPILVRLSEVGPSATAFWRVSLALLPLGLFAALMRGQTDATSTPRTLREWLTVSAPGIFLGVELVAWHEALYKTSVANATLLVNMTPVFTAFFGWVLFRRPIERLFMSGTAMAVVGVVLLVSSGWVQGKGALSGDATALGAAVIYAGYFMSLGYARQRFSSAVVMFASSASATLIALPLALAEGIFIPASPAGWATVVALAWIVQVGGQGLVTFAIAWLPPTISSLAMLIQPFVAAAIAWGLFEEHLSALQIVGGMAVIGGILIARRG
jgi:drug/metabolite transporter (DMT)-like permease